MKRSLTLKWMKLQQISKSMAEVSMTNYIHEEVFGPILGDGLHLWGPFLPWFCWKNTC